MKKSIFLLSALFIIATLSAQTYKNGTWYSYYNEEGFQLENGITDFAGVEQEVTDIFAPTAKQLSFDWEYKLWSGVTPIIESMAKGIKGNNTVIYESADNGASHTQVGTLTDKEFGNYKANIKLSANINWLKWERQTGNFHNVISTNIRIPLAKHILFADGLYGTNNTEIAFEDALNIGEVSNEPITVSLRSFLTDGDITVTSSDPSFRISNPFVNKPHTFQVGANACASANGKADAECAEGVLGDIKKYNVEIYFSPVRGGLIEGEITLTDGTSTATIKVSGTGIAQDQTITWEPETEILSNAEIALATASSGLACTYSFQPEGIVEFADGKLNILSDGEVDITAKQNGNEAYNAAAELTRHFIIHPAVTYSTYEGQVCPEGTIEFMEQELGAGSHEIKIANVWGGDSIITVNVTELETSESFEEATINQGDEFEWNGQVYTDSVAGEYTQELVTTNAVGCDSIATLHLIILEVADGIEEIELDRLGEQVKFLHEGQLYIRRGDEIYDAKGQKVQ